MWTPQPKQRLALASPAFELFFGGARGGGKSDFLLADFTRNIKFGSDYKGVLFRHTYPQLEELIARSYDLYKPLGARFNLKSNNWVFPGGAILKMRPLDSDDDVKNYQGHNYQWAAFDELTNWATDFCYTTILGTIRSAKGVPCCMRAAANPKSAGHLWVKKRFIDVAPPMTMYLDPGTNTHRVFIPSTLDDNVILMKNDPGYADRLKALPPHLYKAHRYGDWDAMEGQFFEEFERADHVVAPFPVPTSWKKFLCMDWGYSKPYAIFWVAVDHDGRGWVYREMYGRGPGDKDNVGSKEDAIEVARRAWQASLFEGVTDIVADPACWAKIGLGNSVAGQFERVGFRMHKADNDRVNGWMRLHQVLKERNEDRPMIQIFSTCTNLIRTLPALPVDETKPDDVNTDSEDHAGDAIRYGAMSKFWMPYNRRKGFGKKKVWNPLD